MYFHHLQHSLKEDSYEHIAEKTRNETCWNELEELVILEIINIADDSDSEDDVNDDTDDHIFHHIEQVAGEGPTLRLTRLTTGQIEFLSRNYWRYWRHLLSQSFPTTHYNHGILFIIYIIFTIYII